MNSKFKKILALVLVLLMALGSVAAAADGGAAEIEEEAETEINPEEKPEINPEEKPEIKPEEKPEVNPEEKPEINPEEKPEVNPEEKPEVNPEEKPEINPEEKPEVNPEEKPEVNTEEAPRENQETEISEEPSEKSPEQELYERLTETSSMEEFDAIYSALTQQQIEALNLFLQQDSAMAERLWEHIREIDREIAVGPTVTFTQAGPFMPPVTVETLRQLKALEGETDNGIQLAKSAVKNPDGTYTITLESYTTGEVKTEIKSIPVDIVLVIDQSGSMDYDFGGISRQQAMKNAVNSFIDGVSEKYSKDGDHRMALVEFRSGASLIQGWTEADGKGAKILKSRVNGLSAGGATNVGAGMQQAEMLMGSGYHYEGSNIQRQKVVIVFTDGIPTTSNEFSTEVANAAVASARNLKASGVTVYSIGIFEGANPNQTYGGADPQASWSASWGIIGGGDIGGVDIPAGNRFLNYVSSNYPNAVEIGLERISRDYVFYQKVTYNVTASYSGSNAGYYLSAENSADLQNIFKTISDQISSPAVDLGSKAVVRDVISPYFTVPSADNISVFTADFNGSSFESPVKSPLKATVNGDTVSVTGFDYTENFVSQKPKADGSYGKKLIIQFDVKAKEEFWGGNAVPTNGESSGLYPDAESEKLLENFTVPKVDVELNLPLLQGEDRNIYLMGRPPEAEELCNFGAFQPENSWQGEFLRISCTADREVSSTRDGQYSISVKAEPVNSGSVQPYTQTVTSNVNVYTPKLIYSDSSIFLGEAADYTRNSNGKVLWFHGSEQLGEDTVMTGREPELNISYTPEAGKFTQDTDVAVVVKIGDYEVTKFVTVKNSTTGKVQGITDDHAFTVEVKGCTLTVTKGGQVGQNEGFIFHVTGPEGFERTVAVKGSGSVCLGGLAIGEYRVEENDGWAWKYNSDGVKTAVLSPEMTEGAVTVINIPKGVTPIGGEECVINTTADKTQTGGEEAK